MSSLEDLVARREQWRADGVRLVTTNGIFDVLHRGHLHLLESAAALGDVLVVAVNSDRSTRALKGPTRPVNPLDDRMAMLAALRPVTAVVAFDEDTASDVLAALRPDVHCKGSDYVDPRRLPEWDVVTRAGGEVHLIDVVPGRSTTATVERLRGSGS